MIKTIKYLPISLFLFLLSTSQAAAQFELPEGKNVGMPTGKEGKIGPIITDVIQWFLALVGVIALVVLVWAGVSYMTAGGDEEKVQKAKTRLTYGILGVAVAIGGLVIMYFIRKIFAGTAPGSISL